jgi:hypothetical protein
MRNSNLAPTQSADDHRNQFLLGTGTSEAEAIIADHRDQFLLGTGTSEAEAIIADHRDQFLPGTGTSEAEAIIAGLIAKAASALSGERRQPERDLTHRIRTTSCIV